jgi:hypothetical protein
MTTETRDKILALLDEIKTLLSIDDAQTTETSGETEQSGEAEQTSDEGKTMNL